MEKKCMKKLLITGFEPFGGEVINPSMEAVDLLLPNINGYVLTKLCVPVIYGEAARQVIREAERIGADVILCIGQAGGRNAITPELVGINLRNASIPDHAMYMPKDEPIESGGDAAYFSSLPVRKMAEAIASAGIPARVSYSAGAYVCNDLLYSLLAHFNGSKTRVGFIHVPYSREQNKDPSMELGDIVKALTVAIENIDL